MTYSVGQWFCMVLQLWPSKTDALMQSQIWVGRWRLNRTLEKKVRSIVQKANPMYIKVFFVVLQQRRQKCRIWLQSRKLWPSKTHSLMQLQIWAGRWRRSCTLEKKIRSIVQNINPKNLFMSFCMIFLYIILGWYHNNLGWKYCLLF